MRALLLSLCAVVPTITTLAAPQPQTGVVSWQVSADDGATWYPSITINPGSPYRIRAVATWTDAVPLEPSHGFAGCTFEQLDLIGADASDVFGGASGPHAVPTYRVKTFPLAEPWTLQPGTGASEGFLKLENVSSVRRLNFGQLKYECWGGGIPHYGYIFDNPILLLDMDAVAGDPKPLTISAVWTRLGAPATNEFKVYINSCGTTRKPLEEAVTTPAHVWIRPNASCIPDFNGDGLVDFADYLDFLTFYDTEDFRADLNRDGLIDFADYLDFLTAFDAGC